MVKVHEIRNGKDCDIIPKVTHKTRLLTKNLGPHIGMEPIRADHKVELAGPGTTERQRNPGIALREGGDRVVKDILCVLPGRLVENAGQVAAHNLEFAAGEPIGQTGNLLVCFVHDRNCTSPGFELLHLGQDAHALQRVQSSAAKVDRVSSRPHRGSAFDDGGMETVAAEPEGKRRPGDARARDQNVLVLQVFSSQKLYSCIRQTYHTPVWNDCVN